MPNKARGDEYADGFPVGFEAFFNSPAPTRQARELVSIADIRGKAHGRRVVLVVGYPGWIDKKEHESWLGLKSIVCVEACREEIGSRKKSVQKRHCLTSPGSDAQKLQESIRQHWSIENQCHWILDVTFDEDRSRVRKGHAAVNLAMLRKVSLGLLKHDTSIKDTIREKRYRAALSENILEDILFPQFSR